jgi:hypothetical protein
VWIWNLLHTRGRTQTEGTERSSSMWERERKWQEDGEKWLVRGSIICIVHHIVAYLPHARKVEPQNQPFISNTHTNNGTVGLRNPFLGYGSVNTSMQAHDITLQQYWLGVTWLIHGAKFLMQQYNWVFCAWSVQSLYNATLVIFQIVQFRSRWGFSWGFTCEVLTSRQRKRNNLPC